MRMQAPFPHNARNALSGRRAVFAIRLAASSRGFQVRARGGRARRSTAAPARRIPRPYRPARRTEVNLDLLDRRRTWGTAAAGGEGEGK
jgi:hypothetical protein